MAEPDLPDGTYDPGPRELTQVLFRSAEQLKKIPEQYYRRIHDADVIAEAKDVLFDSPLAIDNDWGYDESVGRIICVRMSSV